MNRLNASIPMLMVVMASWVAFGGCLYGPQDYMLTSAIFALVITVLFAITCLKPFRWPCSHKSTRHKMDMKAIEATVQGVLKKTSTITMGDLDDPYVQERIAAIVERRLSKKGVRIEIDDTPKNSRN